MYCDTIQNGLIENNLVIQDNFSIPTYSPLYEALGVNKRDNIEKLLEKWEIELRRGAIQLLVCAVLSDRNLHGTEICDTIYEKTGEVISVPLGTVYPLLHRYQREGLVETMKSPEDKRRTVYILNSRGKEFFKGMEIKWNEYSVAVSNILHTR